MVPKYARKMVDARPVDSKNRSIGVTVVLVLVVLVDEFSSAAALHSGGLTVETTVASRSIGQS